MTTSSTPRSWRWPPTGWGSRHAWWWAAALTRKGWVRGRNVLAWVEIRVADGSWRILPQNRFMSHRPPKRSDTSQPAASYVQRTTKADTPPQSSPAAQQPPDSRNQDQSADSSVSPLVWLIPLGTGWWACFPA